MCNSDNRADRETNYLNRLEEQRVAGVLLTPVDPESPLLDQISARGTPIVIVDRTRSGGTHCSVAVDDVLGGRLALEHLLDRGHERIAFIGGPATIGQVRDRHAGALAALADAGLDESNLLRIDTVDAQRRRGAAGRPAAGRHPRCAPAHRGLLRQRPARPRPAPAVRDDRGVACPGDLAIVGYDDIEYAGAAAVPLTSVRQPRLRLGRTAAELLLDEVENPDHAHQQIIFTPELVARASTIGRRAESLWCAR